MTDKKQYPGKQYLDLLIANMEFAAMAPIEVVRVIARELKERRKAEMDSEPVYQVFEPSDGRWVDVDDEEDMIRQRSIGGITRTLYSAPPTPVVDSEPVAYMWDSKRNDIDAPGFYFPEHLFFAESNVKQWGGEVIPLYRHAQQPVVQPVPECQHQWKHGGANKLQNQKQCIKCGRVELDAQPAPEYPETLPCPVLLEPGMRFGKGVKTRLVLDAIQRRSEHYAELEGMTPEERAEYDANIEAFKAILPQPAPVVPDAAQSRAGGSYC